jgi:putative flippase GtrA
MKLRRMVASGLGGAVATAADIATLVLQVEHGVPVALAAFVACTVGAAVCFTLNKYVAFRDSRPVSARQLARFGVVAVGAALLMALAMQLIAVELHVPYVLAKLACSAAVFLGWTYPVQRRLVFSHVVVRSSP